MKKVFLLAILLLASCSPYWKDQPDQTSPANTPTPRSPSAAPVPINGWAEYTVVGQVNIRSEPSTSSPSIGWLLPGAVVVANCQRSDEFCKVVGGYVVEACLGIGDGKCQNKGN